MHLSVLPCCFMRCDSRRLPLCCVACNQVILRILNREPCDLSELMYSSARLRLSRGAQTRAPSINWQKLRKSCLTAQTASKAWKSESESESESRGRWHTEHWEQWTTGKKNSEKMYIKQLKRHTVGLLKGKEAPPSPQTAPNKYYISRKCEEIQYL